MAKVACFIVLEFVLLCFVADVILAQGRPWKRGRGFMGNKSREFDNAESQLHRDLLKGYYRYARPVESFNESVTVNLGLQLTNLGSVDFQWQTLSANFWLMQVWHDFRLTWDPAEYDGVNTIRMNPYNIWYPDITLYNNYGSQYKESSLVAVFHDGTCFWIPHVRYIALCNYDLSKFPYDTQYCSLQFGSWTYNGHEVNLVLQSQLDVNQSNSFFLQQYRGHYEWDVSKVNESVSVKYYPCCPEPFPSMVYWIRLKRLSTAHTYIFVTPCVLLTFLVPFIFLLPQESKQKIQLGIGIFVCLTVLLLMLLQTLPAAFAKPPIIAVFMVSSMVLVAISIILSTVTSGMWTNITTKREMHSVLRLIFLDILGKALCVDRGAYNVAHSAKSNDGDYGKDTQTMETTDTAAVLAVPKVTDAIAGEWYAFVAVLDRLLFLIFLVVSIIVAVAFSV